MSCDQFKKNETGEMEPREFRQHLKACSYCREQEKLDARLMNLAGSLKGPMQSPGLWDRIEQALAAEEERRQRRFKFMGVYGRSISFYLAAAVLIIAVAVGVYFWQFGGKQEPGLLSQTVLNKIESKEKEYIKAIEELEQQALPRMAGMNIELMLLYRDRLETIDDQIEKCREALSENPANSHIRRYMLAALQDKQETLLELTGSR